MTSGCRLASSGGGDESRPPPLSPCPSTPPSNQPPTTNYQPAPHLQPYVLLEQGFTQRKPAGAVQRAADQPAVLPQRKTQDHAVGAHRGRQRPQRRQQRLVGRHNLGRRRRRAGLRGGGVRRPRMIKAFGSAAGAAAAESSTICALTFFPTTAARPPVPQSTPLAPRPLHTPHLQQAQVVARLLVAHVLRWGK